MFTVVDEHVFPFLRGMGGNNSTYAHHMKDARFTIPTLALLSKVVDMLDHVPMEDRETKGDLYEYMLSKIASAVQNGQFRTPRHIIQLMVELTAPTRKKMSSATRPAAPAAFWSLPVNTCARNTRKFCSIPNPASISTTSCFTATILITPCCASAV